MPYDYDVHTTEEFVLIRGVGSQWTGRDILASAEQIIADDRFAPDHDWIYDVRFVHQTVITTEEMERIVEQFRRYQETGQVDPESRSVIVGTDENLRFSGTLYKYKADRREGQLEIKETLDEALDWLGLDREAVEALTVDSGSAD